MTYSTSPDPTTDPIVQASKNGLGFTMLYRFMAPTSSIPISLVIGMSAGFALNWVSNTVAASTANPMLGIAVGGATAEGMELNRFKSMAMMGAGAAGGWFITDLDQ